MKEKNLGSCKHILISGLGAFNTFWIKGQFHWFYSTEYWATGDMYITCFKNQLQDLRFVSLLNTKDYGTDTF